MTNAILHESERVTRNDVRNLYIATNLLRKIAQGYWAKNDSVNMNLFHPS